MTQQKRHKEYKSQDDDTFKRHGPEPPENDSGPSPSVDDQNRATNRETAAPDPSSPRNSRVRPQR